jgi:hypothetical protein
LPGWVAGGAAASVGVGAGGAPALAAFADPIAGITIAPIATVLIIERQLIAAFSISYFGGINYSKCRAPRL